MDKEVFYRNFIQSAVKKEPENLKIDIYSFLVCLILDVNLFKRNADLHSILDSLVFQNRLKDYLFASRTQLLAKVIREFNRMDDSTLRKNITIFAEFFSIDLENTSDNLVKKMSEKQKKEIEKNLDLIKKYRRNISD